MLQRGMALRARRIKMCLFCIPGHSANPGNEMADHLAEQVVSMDADYGFPLVSPNRRAAHKKI